MLLFIVLFLFWACNKPIGLRQPKPMTHEVVHGMFKSNCCPRQTKNLLIKQLKLNFYYKRVDQFNCCLRTNNKFKSENINK